MEHSFFNRFPLPGTSSKALQNHCLLGQQYMDYGVISTPFISNPAFMSLKRPHSIWSTVGSSPAKVAMATVQAQMLSGRYRTQHLCSLLSQNTSEFCKLSDECATTTEDIEHILKFCPGLSTTRKKLQNYCLSYCENNDAIKPIVEKCCDPSHPQSCI